MTPEQAERVARRFHEVYEEQAPQCGYETRKDTRKPWSQVPPENRRTMIKTIMNVFAEFGITIE